MHAGIVEGSTEQPKVNKGRPAVNERRDELIEILIKSLQIKFGLPRLSNPLNRSRDNAIEIVLDELKGTLKALGNIEPTAIEKAIKRREKLRSSDPIIAVLDHRT